MLLDQAKEAWKLVNRLGVKSLGNDLEIINNMAEIEIVKGGAKKSVEAN